MSNIDEKDEKAGVGVIYIKQSEKDTWNTKIGDTYTGMYYYMLGGDLNTLNNADNTQMLGNCPTIESIIVTPFLDPYTLPIRLIQIPYDKKRFGSTGDTTLTGLTDDCSVFRIADDSKGVIEKDLSQFIGFWTKQSINPPKTRSWKNESKLFQYPYSYALLCDHFNTPFVIKYHHLPNKGYNTLKGVFTVSDKCTYKLYVEGYKGDTVGNMESLVSTVSLQLPVSSSAYSQFLATSRASFVANNESAFRQELVSSAVGMIGSMATGNVVGGLTSAVSGAVGAYNTVQQSMAKVSDLMSSPRSVKSMGNDTIFSLANSRQKIELIRYRIEEKYLVKLGDFFALYGYKQNKMMKVNLRSRYYYNYVKMLDCNIVGYNVPKEHLLKIKSIYENGVTTWHMDRQGVQCFDYTMDNYEVY